MAENIEKLHLDDADYITTFTRKFRNRKLYEPVNPKLITSFIPGIVREIKVNVGQVVKKGEPVLIVESMKMLNIIRTPVDGTVKSINVKIDEKIAKNHLMVEIA
ncbi:MAG TPA: acetyl-CoA carboxylase biotin carboxyl carrier protein subunit [Bacteroidales bacterium]|nr:acetyl-CoA carboxylase biotin carboxyl carrier protein subunit [Bacteroidales bacterium]